MTSGKVTGDKTMGAKMNVGALSFVVPGLGQFAVQTLFLGLQYLLAALLIWPLALPIVLNGPFEARAIALALLISLHLGAGLTAVAWKQRADGLEKDLAKTPRAYSLWSNVTAGLCVLLILDLFVRWLFSLPSWSAVASNLPFLLIGKLRAPSNAADLWRLWGFVPIALGLILGWNRYRAKQGGIGIILGLVGLIAGSVILWPVVSNQVLGGLAMSLTLAIWGIALALPLGLLAGIGRISEIAVVRVASTIWIELFRSIPFVAVIFWFYICLPYVLGKDTQLYAVILALAIFTSAYIGEIVRAGLQSLPPGQTEASRSLGLSGTQAMVQVVLPQAVQNMIPPLVGQFISLFKDTSLTSVVSIFELFSAGRSVANRLGNATFEVYLTIALIYFVFNYGLSRLASSLEGAKAKER
jgi:His/Glu/Gln/Arg/opine family amino acid ABC transporter permease subunit